MSENENQSTHSTSHPTETASAAAGAPGLSPPPSRRRMSPLAIVLALSAVFFVIFLMVSGMLFFFRGSSIGGDKPAPSAFFGGGSVAVIELNGVIMDSKKTLARLERLEEDDQIRAVVLRLNSPGGSVAPSQEIYEAVKAYKKPIVVSMGAIAASGAFYIACAAKKVYANPGTITGSIGVIMEFANLEKLYEWARIKRYSIKTGKFKDAGAEYREMRPEERELLQGMVDNVLMQFKQAVASGRKLSMDAVTAIADGRIMSGQQAKAAKLVDELGTIQDAINEAAKLAGIKGKPNLIYPERKKRKWLDLILDDGVPDESSSQESRRGWVVDLLRTVLGIADSGSRLEDPVTGLVPGIYWLWNGPR